MTSSRYAVFSNPVRTAIGTFGGSLKEIAAPDLGAAVIKAAVQRAGLRPEDVGAVVMGNVIQASVSRRISHKRPHARVRRGREIFKICSKGAALMLLAILLVFVSVIGHNG